MKVLIIEDERPAALKLERMLREIDPGIEIAGRLESVEDTTNWWLSNSPPDLLLMDIQLEDGLCFEIFENVAIRTPVIFITAFDEYALKAFKVNSIDYLLKPVDPGSLRTAIQKFKTYFRTEDYTEIFENLLNQLQTKTKERFLIKVGEHYKSIQTADIACFFIRERYCFIGTFRGKEYAVDFSLDTAEKWIDPERFYRVNRNFIINYAAIKDVVAYSSSRLKIKSEGWEGPEDILVSRERVAAFKAWMDR
ncbi:MAG TPA: LytTR family DNA-binding domain-containing protein [Bacteroidales bacterium]|nr:LytTR family DNA-binding domain-containing protein [Bacteroidales bacterium]